MRSSRRRRRAVSGLTEQARCCAGLHRAHPAGDISARRLLANGTPVPATSRPRDHRAGRTHPDTALAPGAAPPAPRRARGARRARDRDALCADAAFGHSARSRARSTLSSCLHVKRGVNDRLRVVAHGNSRQLVNHVTSLGHPAFSVRRATGLPSRTSGAETVAVGTLRPAAINSRPSKKIWLRTPATSSLAPRLVGG